jgi:hypothetical protein
VPRDEAVHDRLGLVAAGLARLHPAARRGVQLLDDVVVYGCASVVP